MEDLQGRWPEEFDTTSSHQFRDADDMQFAFSYFYYLMRATRNRTFAHLAVEQDVDGDGLLNYLELRRLVAIAAIGAKENVDLEGTRARLLGNESAPETPVPVKAVLRDAELKKLAKKALHKERKYKYELGDMNNVGFYMLKDNSSSLVDKLDEVRAHPTKFLCFNDNMNETDPDLDMRQELQDLLQTLFPLPSSFELRPGSRGYLRVEDWRSTLRIRAVSRTLTRLALALAVSSAALELHRQWQMRAGGGAAPSPARSAKSSV